MQRKTKIKIIFYSIGCISIALLPYVVTKDEEPNQRYAPLPSYNNVDTAHPFLSRLSQTGSKLKSLFSSNPSEQTNGALDSSSIEALNEAAAKEVLASLDAGSAKGAAATANKTKAAAAAQAAAAGGATAPAAAEEGAAAGEGATAEELKGQALFANRAAPYSGSFAGANAARQPLNMQGQAQHYASAGNALKSGSKAGTELDNLIAQNDALLARTNSWGSTGKAGKGGRSAASKTKGSYKSRFQKAKNNLKQAAAMRAAARDGHVYKTHSVAEVPPTALYSEMLAQQGELNTIFAIKAEQELNENANATVKVSDGYHNGLDALSAIRTKPEEGESGNEHGDLTPFIKAASAGTQSPKGMLEQNTEEMEGDPALYSVSQDMTMGLFGISGSPDMEEAGASLSEGVYTSRAAKWQNQVSTNSEYVSETDTNGLDSDKMKLMVAPELVDLSFIPASEKNLNEISQQIPQAAPLVKARQAELEGWKKMYQEKGCGNPNDPCIAVATKPSAQNNVLVLADTVYTQTPYELTSVTDDQNVTNWDFVPLSEYKKFIEQNPDTFVYCGEPSVCAAIRPNTPNQSQILPNNSGKPFWKLGKNEFSDSINNKTEENIETIQKKADDDMNAADTINTKNQVLDLSQKNGRPTAK